MKWLIWATTCPFFLLINVVGCAFSGCGGQGALFTARAGSSPRWPPCRTQALGARASVVAACRAESTGSGAGRAGLAAPRPVQSSRTGDRTRVPCAGRQTPVHCTAREVPASCSRSTRPCEWKALKRPGELDGQYRRLLLDGRAFLECLRTAPFSQGLPKKYRWSVCTQVISKCY